jgi:hypothetical protein
VLVTGGLGGKKEYAPLKPPKIGYQFMKMMSQKYYSG